MNPNIVFSPIWLLAVIPIPALMFPFILAEKNLARKQILLDLQIMFLIVQVGVLLVGWFT